MREEWKSPRVGTPTPTTCSASKARSSLDCSTVFTLTLEAKPCATKQTLSFWNSSSVSLESKADDTAAVIDQLFPGYETDNARDIQEMDAERELHLAFLFAGPLVTAYKDEGQVKIKPMASLEYDKEIEQIVRNAGEACQGIKYKKCVATLDSFQQCMNEQPLALHFTGHGIRNNAFGTERLNEGDFLVFEDERGKAQYVSCQELKGILRACPRQPEFVFVSSCHSRLVGDVFKAAGAKHVICVKRSEQILDEVASMFAQAFYKAFFSPHSTVCSAFELAKATVTAKTSEHDIQKNECMKFELLIGGDYAMPHSCANLHPIPVGQPVSTVPPVEYGDIPSKVEHFVGRKCELYNIISLIHEARIVTIKGLPGIGKTSVAKTLAHFFLERGVFRDGVVYISARGVESTDALITQLYIASKASSDDPSKDKLATVVCALQSKHLLLILDNAEDPLNKDRVHFLSTIHALLGQAPKLKVLITSRTALGPLPDLTEKVYNLFPLDPRSAVLLLEKRAPRKITSSEIDELLSQEMVPLPATNSAEQDGSWKFEEHKLMQLLAGHPQAISLAAALLQGRTLKEIYQELMSSSLRANEMHSLKISLSLSIEHVKMRNPDSVRFFRMMGLFPCGACSEDMKTIWGPGYKEHVDNLLYVSLLVRQEAGDLQEDRYWLLPFMADYAANYLKDHNIDDVLQRGCEYYSDKLEKAFMTDCNFVSGDTSKFLIKDEPNIVAFLGSGRADLDRAQIEEQMSDVDPAVQSEEKEPCEVLAPENAGKGPVPSREAAEQLGTEESRLACTKAKTNEVTMERRGKRRNSEQLEEALPLLQLEREHSETLHCCSSSVAQTQRIRKMSLVGVEEEKQYYTGNESGDPDATVAGAGDEEGTKKKCPAPKAKITMTSYGRLLVYYCANLIISQRYNDAKRTIQSYIETPAIVQDTLTCANLYKLLGLVTDKMQDLSKQKDYTDIKKYYCKAKIMFFKSFSALGQAACLVAIGEIERQHVLIHSIN